MKIILASKSEVRKKILNQNSIRCEVVPANIDEELIKNSLLKEKASPELISKNLAELKANKVSEKRHNHLVLGADSVIDLNGELISKPTNRDEAFAILKKLNGQKHQLISSGEAFSLSKEFLISSSSIFAGTTSHLILF